MPSSIVSNGGFESSTSSFSPWVAQGGTVGIDVNIAPYQGTNHLHVAQTTFYQDVKCNVGSSYKLTFYAVAIGNSEPPIRTTFGTLDRTFSIQNGGGSDWTQYSGTGKCSTSSSRLTFYSLDTVTVRIDAISLITSDVPTTTTAVVKSPASSVVLISTLVVSSQIPPSNAAASTVTVLVSSIVNITNPSGGTAATDSATLINADSSTPAISSPSVTSTSGSGVIDAASSSKSSSDTGAIVGGVIGGLSLILIAATVFWYLRRRLHYQFQLPRSESDRYEKRMGGWIRTTDGTSRGSPDSPGTVRGSMGSLNSAQVGVEMWSTGESTPGAMRGAGTSFIPEIQEEIMSEKPDRYESFRRPRRSSSRSQGDSHLF